MQGDRNLTLIKFGTKEEREKAINSLAHSPTWVISAHEDPMVLDLTRDQLLKIYQKGIEFELYHEPED